MKNILFALLFVLGGSLFSQNYNKGLHIILQSVDTVYFDENGARWTEFSLSPRKYFKVMDLMESDSTCGCEVIKGNEHYVYYLKQNGRYDKEDKKFHKKIIGYLECRREDYELYMWIGNDESFGFMVTETIQDMTYFPPFEKFSLYDESVETTTNISSSPIIEFIPPDRDTWE